MADGISNEWKTIKIKADLLCMGIRPNKVTEAIYRRQNPLEDWKTGNVGLHISLENKSHVLVTVSHLFDQNSPYSIEYQGKQLVLLKGREVVNQIKEVPMPDWYNKKTTKNPLSKIFLHEGSKFLHQTYKGCDYFGSSLFSVGS